MTLANGVAPLTPLFGSMLMGGFECAAHRLRGGQRLDLTASTGHDARAADDYRLLARHGMGAARDGLRWHLIESRRGRYDWSSFLPMLHAACDTGMPVVWDLLHYGVPSGVDIFGASFVDRFADFARAAAQLVHDETGAPPLFTPINEISFWSWAGGDTGGLNPFARGRGGEMKRQLVRAYLAAAAACREVDPRVRIACAEPLIQIMPSSLSQVDIDRARAHNEGQFEALDMLLGRRAPELGGSPDAVDIVGINYYYNNQWVDNGRTIYLGDAMHRPLSHMLAEVAARYDQPLYLAETGTEGVFRPFWFRYICDEVRAAAALGAGIGGICLYPVISHLGWDDSRHCPNGAFDGFGPDCARTDYQPLTDELAAQAARFAGETTPAGTA